MWHLFLSHVCLCLSLPPVCLCLSLPPSLCLSFPEPLFLTLSIYLSVSLLSIALSLSLLSVSLSLLLSVSHSPNHFSRPYLSLYLLLFTVFPNLGNLCVLIQRFYTYCKAVININLFTVNQTTSYSIISDTNTEHSYYRKCFKCGHIDYIVQLFLKSWYRALKCGYTKN